MSANDLNAIEFGLPPVYNIVVCSVCFAAQQCPPPSNSVKVRFCLAEWPARKCSACCRCRTCVAYASLCKYGLMMEMAVFNYMELPVGFFELYCSMDLE